jgi:tRNA(His) 5'-end guanylyltransferase
MWSAKRMRELFRVKVALKVEPEGISFDERARPIYNAHFKDFFHIHQIELFKYNGVAKGLFHTEG